MTRISIDTEYFNWLYDFACKDRYSGGISYKKLLTYLHSTDFRYNIVPRDENRADDGRDLRYRFALNIGFGDYPESITNYLDGPCSVLEMIVALAIRCEETIMDDASIGDRTSQWFWGMITNLGLGSMDDDRFDKNLVKEIIERFLNRDYESNGNGGLFTVKYSDLDMRAIEIWHQLCLYLDSIT